MPAITRKMEAETSEQIKKEMFAVNVFNMDISKQNAKVEAG